jgi:hypothetical protein
MKRWQRCGKNKAALGLVGAFALLLSSWSSSAAQKGQPIPEELKASLDSRLHQFTQAQAEGRWDEVAALLGRYRQTGSQHLYTEAHKQCLLTQMRSMPMVAFTLEQVTFSSELYSLPAGREKWWDLIGTAKFKTSAGENTGQSSITAYLDHQEWYFTPPNYDQMWERSQVKEEDLSRDRRDELEIQTAPGLPVELTDVHVFMDKKFLSLRDLQFRLRNKSDKPTFGYSLYLGREGGNILSGGPLRLAPGETSPVIHFSYSAYSFYCEENSKRTLEIDGIDFADGTAWKSPRHDEQWGAGKDAAPKDPAKDPVQ